MKDVYTLDDLRDWRESNLRYAVLGDPVAHSASPAMHNAVLEHLALPERYCRLHISPGQLAEAIGLLPRAGFLGVNLTIPHKTQILPLLDQVDAHSRRLGAINTVAFCDGKITGTNTDGPGIVRAIHEEFGVALGGLRILVLGAGGGAGRAIATQCQIEGCAALLLVNRTEQKILELARNLDATVIPWTDKALADQLANIDLIINASSVGMKSGDPSPLRAEWLGKSHLVYDTIYVGRQTPLQTAATNAGASSANGLSLLLHQGVLALEYWLGRPVPVEVMRLGLEQFINRKS